MKESISKYQTVVFAKKPSELSFSLVNLTRETREPYSTSIEKIVLISISFFKLPKIRLLDWASLGNIESATDSNSSEMLLTHKHDLDILRECQRYEYIEVNQKFFLRWFYRFNQLVSWDEIENKVESLHAEAEKLQIPVCLSHNDIWQTNILYDRETGE